MGNAVILIPLTTSASLIESFGTITFVMPIRLAEIRIGKRPRIDLNEPSKESSPTKRKSVILEISSWPDATRIAIAIGRSNADPLLGSQAGDRDTVTLWFGQR